MLAQHAPQLALLHLRRDRRRHPGRQLVLQLEQIGGGAGEAVGPDRRAALAVAELGRQAHLVAGAVHAAGQHVAHGELAPHALRLVHRAAIAQHRGAADHDQLGQARQRRDDGLDQPVGNHEAPPSSVWSTKGSTAIEGRRRWKLSTSPTRPRAPTPRPRAGRPDGIGVHRPAHVAQLERPQLLDRLLEAAGDQVHHRRRHQHAADRRMLLQARHDVDAVAQQVGALDGDLAHVDGAAQLEPHRRVRRDGRPRATAACTARAARVASTGPVNSTSSPSPSALKMRPPPAVISGSIAWRSARHAPSTRSSSASTRALKFTTSNATTTTSRRPPFAALPALAFARLRAMRENPRLTMEPYTRSPQSLCAGSLASSRRPSALRAIDANAAGSCRKGTPAETACG